LEEAWDLSSDRLKKEYKEKLELSSVYYFKTTSIMTFSSLLTQNLKFTVEIRIKCGTRHMTLHFCC